MAKRLQPAVTCNVGSGLKQFRFAPIKTGGETAFLAIHSNCAEDDPWAGMFFLPTDTLKLTAFTATGQRLWHRDLGTGMIPGIWFCPVMAFDLDGDGDDEIWLVANSDPDHPLDHRKFRLDRLSGRTGQILQSIPWPAIDSQPEHQPRLPQLHPGRLLPRPAPADHRPGHLRRDAAAVLGCAAPARLDANHRQGRTRRPRLAHVPRARHRRRRPG